MVLAVLLVALVVPFVLNTDTYKERYESERTQAEVAKSNEQAAIAAIAAQEKVFNDNLTKQSLQVSSLQEQLTARDKILQDKDGEIITLQNSSSDVRSKLATLAAAEKEHAQILTIQDVELKDRREKMLKMSTQNIETVAQLQEKTTESDGLQRRVRLLEEQLADLTNQNANLRDKIATTETTTTTAVTPQPSQPILASVTDVRQVGDNLIVGLNVGNNDSVASGMVFLLHENDTFLGNLTINTVDDNASAGIVSLQQGDISVETEALAGGN